MRFLKAAAAAAMLSACNAVPEPAPSPYDPNATARAPIGETATLEAGNARIVTHTLGDGPEIVMFASAGREASDFNELATGLAGAGYRVTLIEAPGINGAAASKDAPTLFDLADDAAIYLQTRDEPVILVGHAFGNRVARATATRHPEQVRGVILIGAGGLKSVPPRAGEALRNSFNPALPAKVHEAEVRYGFFANDNPIPDYWLRGWHPVTVTLQSAATRSVDSAEWWTAGGKPLLVIAGLQDTIAPPEDTIALLEAELGDQVTAVRLDGAGHALLPEQPDAILQAILDWTGAL